MVVDHRFQRRCAADVGVHRAALDRARAGSAPPRPPGRRTPAASAGAAWPSARATPPGTPRRSRRAAASRRPRARTGRAWPGRRRCPCVRPPGRWRSAAPRACRDRAGRTSPNRLPRSRLCPTAARCGSPSAPTPPGTRRRSAGRRSPCRRSGCPCAAAGSRSASPGRSPARECPRRRVDSARFPTG